MTQYLVITFSWPTILYFTLTDYLNSHTTRWGGDEIPSFIIKRCSEIFAPLLSHIFNISLLEAKFPTMWKQAAIMPVFKKGNSALITNYGPITI
jgi:hypothetical protein